MSAWTAVRWTNAHWLLPLLFGSGVYVGVSNPTYETGYVTAEYAAAARSVVLLGPVLAVAAAYRMRDLRRALRNSRATRSPVIVFLSSSWPVLLGGPAVGVLAAVSTVRTVPDEWRGWAVCAIVATTLAACVCLGALLGHVLPRIAAIPLAGMVAFAWLALPATGDSAWLRNMNSSFVGCCSAASTPSTTNYMGSLSVTFAVVVLTLILSSTRNWWVGAAAPALAGAAVALVIGLLAGAAAVAVSPMRPNLLAVEARQTVLKCAPTAASGQVCVWPERSSRLPDAVRLVNEADAALRSIGAETLPLVSERPSTGAIEFTAAVPTAEDAKFSLAQGIVIASAGACKHVDTAPRFEEMVAYASLLLGVDERRWIRRGYSRSSLDRASAARALPSSEQRVYFDAGRSAVNDSCTHR